MILEVPQRLSFSSKKVDRFVSSTQTTKHTIIGFSSEFKLATIIRFIVFSADKTNMKIKGLDVIFINKYFYII